MNYGRTKTRVLALYCVLILGILLFGAGVYVLGQRYISAKTEAAAVPDVFSIIESTSIPETEVMVSGNPVHLKVNSADIDIEITDGFYNIDDGTWTLSKNMAHFAVMSSKPNNLVGNTYIYGHNRREVFASLHKVSVGSEAVVTTDNGYAFYYKFIKVFETVPSDTNIVTNVDKTSGPILSLQTCSGLWFQKRQVYIFSFDRYE